MANEIQTSLASGRQIEHLNVEDSSQMVKNVKIFRSNRIRDFLVVHTEKSPNERKNRDFVDLSGQIFKKLVGGSSLAKIGKVNNILRSANLSTPKHVRETTTEERNRFKSMIQLHELDQCQRTNRSPPGICLGFSFHKEEFKTFFDEYINKHEDFIRNVTSLTVCSDEGELKHQFINI